MRFYFTPEQEAFRAELAEFFKREIPPGYNDRISCSTASPTAEETWSGPG